MEILKLAEKKRHQTQLQVETPEHLLKVQQRRKRYGSGARASCIPNRVSIEERPHVVEKKARIGDWECDTVIGKDRKSVLVTVGDRASLYTVCSRVLSRSARVVCAAIIRLLRPFKARVKTLTFDNGDPCDNPSGFVDIDCNGALGLTLTID